MNAPALSLVLLKHAPSFDILGSFLPVWMICLTTGIVLAFLCRILLIRRGMENEVGPLALFYPGVVILFSSLMWLAFFR